MTATDPTEQRRPGAGTGSEPERVLVRWSGDLDGHVAPALREEVDALVVDGPVEVDLRDVTFIDSAGIGALFKLHQRVADAGQMLVATGPQPSVRRALEATGLHRVIAILDGP